MTIVHSEIRVLLNLSPLRIKHFGNEGPNPMAISIPLSVSILPKKSGEISTTIGFRVIVRISFGKPNKNAF